jgi:tight adherence protein B
MMDNPITVFLVLVFLAMFLLMQGLVAPAFGSSARMRRRLRRRLQELSVEPDGEAAVSLLRRRYLDRLSPLERRLEALPGMPAFRRVVEQAGIDRPAHRFVLAGIAWGLVSALTAALAFADWTTALGLGTIAAATPFVRLLLRRAKRMSEIEDRLPDAIDIIKRSVRAGHPFIAAIKLVGEDMEGPIADEFAATAADFAYGSDPRAALLGLVSRVPSATLMGFVTAVLIQRETGGNLAEILENISQVIRGRHRFQRKIRTLSAEGRVSAWVLTLVPFGLAAMLHFTSPDYLPVLFESDRGLTMLAFCGVLMVVGIYWMRRIIRIEI